MADEENEKRPQFGGRLLTDPSKVFEHNAWDNVEWNAEHEDEALKKIKENSGVKLDSNMQEKYENEAGHFWDDFYTQHQNRFFKDRHWLFTEFPELGTPANTERDSSNDSVKKLDEDESCSAGNQGLDKQDEEHLQETFTGCHAKKRILEVGCGVGNTIFPILDANNDPGLFVYGCDFSKTAVDLVKEHPDYNVDRCHAFVCDVTNTDFVYPFPDQSLDIIILIFVLSAINPDKMQAVISKLAKLLKPGGVILFRDYGRYDMAQLRFKKGRCLLDNFYVRGDGTRVYFFEQGFVREFNQVSAVRSVNKPQDTMPNQAKLLESRLTLVYEPKNLQVPHQFYNYPEHGNDRTQASPQNQGVEQFGFMKQALVDSTNVNEVKHAPGNHIPDGRIKQLSSKNHCQHCNKTYTSITNLLRHQQFHCSTQMKRPFHCKHCEKLYVSLGALKMHIRTHTLPCKCKICGKAFSRPWLLQGHIRTHTGEKPYKCQQCQRAFADRSNLRAHQQTHSDVKKYCCQRCSKSFSRMSLLHKHEDSCPGLLQHSKIF